MSSLATIDAARDRGSRLSPVAGHHGGRFAAAVLVCSLAFQRFAIPAGAKGIDVVAPLGLLLAAWALHRGTLVVHRGRFILFIALLLWLLIGNAGRAIYPNSYNLTFNLNSILQFLLLTGFCTLSFSQEVDEGLFFRRAGDVLTAVAIAGIMQFFLQILGLRLFAFTGLLPSSILFESGYNLAIPAGIGSLLKSNGLLLLEPSIFSQVMAMGLMIEVLAVRRRYWHLSLLATGLLVSFSGTGWIVLASFFAGTVPMLGKRGIAISFVALAVIFAVALIASLVAPEATAVFSHRFSEFNQPGTSGNLRFVTPYQAVDAVWARESWAWLLGLGAGAAENLPLPFEYNVNTLTKLVIEYGLPGFTLYCALILRADRTPTQRALLFPSFVLLMFTGGYQEFAPVLFPIFLLICVARLRSDSVDPPQDPATSQLIIGVAAPDGRGSHP